MQQVNRMQKIVPTLMVAGVVSLLLSLLLGGFIVYQWVLAIEASITAVALFVFSLLGSSRRTSWPPLLPLAVIFAAGGGKSFYVATDKPTPIVLIVILFAGVIWFVVASLQILRANRQTIK